VEDALSRVEDGVRAQTRIIEDLLDLDRIASGDLRLQLSTVDVASAVRAAALGVLPIAQSKGISLDVADISTTASLRGEGA
jgi:signal transduction histidine kinase